MNAKILHGDCLDILAEIPDASIDAIVTDPPYGLEFMGKEWDSFDKAPRRVAGTGGAQAPFAKHAAALTPGRGRAFQSWCELWTTECFRVLKPGGHLLAFGGSRTWHRLASAIEDSGFEIRDSIAWLYGSGFPKSLDVSKAIDKAAGATREVVGQRDRYRDGGSRQNLGATGTSGDFLGLANGVADITAPATDAAKQWQGYGTSLKPAFEPIVVGRKPLIGTVAANVQAHGTGALNIDATRIGTDVIRSSGEVSDGWRKAEGRADRQVPNPSSHVGRWPTNVVLDDSAAAELDTQSGVFRSHGHGLTGQLGGSIYGNGAGIPGTATERGYVDSGGASRFFPVFGNEPCRIHEIRRCTICVTDNMPTFKYQAKAPKKERPNVDGVAHPTVKPLELMRWLIKLVAPEGATILDPFAGSGTTIEAALMENVNVIGIEREAEYLPLINARIERQRNHS